MVREVLNVAKRGQKNAESCNRNFEYFHRRLGSEELPGPNNWLTPTPARLSLTFDMAVLKKLPILNGTFVKGIAQ